MLKSLALRLVFTLSAGAEVIERFHAQNRKKAPRGALENIAVVQHSLQEVVE